MNDAQTWTLIGTLIAILLAYVTVTATLFIKVVDAKFDGLRNEMVTRLDLLDRDVQRLYERFFDRGESA